MSDSGDGERSQRSDSRRRGRGRPRGTNLSQLAQRAAELQQSLDSLADIQRTHFGTSNSPDASSLSSTTPTSLGSVSDAPAQPLAMQPAPLSYFGRGGSAPGALQHALSGSGRLQLGPRPTRSVGTQGVFSVQSDTALVLTSEGSESGQASGSKRRGSPELEQSFAPRRPGRPRAYQGDDPDNDPNLTEEDRRRIRRRAANRASAHRVRERKLKDQADEEAQGTQLKTQHSLLTQSLAQADAEHGRLAGQLPDIQGMYLAAAAEGGRLQGQLATLRPTGAQPLNKVATAQENSGELQQEIQSDTPASSLAQQEVPWMQPWASQQEFVPNFVSGNMQTQASDEPFSARSLSLPHMQNEMQARGSGQGRGAASSDVPSAPPPVFRSPFAQGPFIAPGPGMPVGKLPLPTTSYAPPSAGPAWQGSFGFPGALPLPPQVPRQQDAGEGWAAMDARLLGISQELPMMPILPPSGEAGSPSRSAVPASTSTAQQTDAEAEPDHWEALFGSGDGAGSRKTLN